MFQKFKVVYEFAGFVSADLIEASSKYNAKKRFYVKNPRAKILKVEPVGKEYDDDGEEDG